MESLAQDQSERAIGLILSGTATDGTLGLEAIKAEGGITFAQDESAKYDSMPRSAVAAGCVDFVLSPEKMAKELARIAKHPYIATVSELSAPAPRSEVERADDQREDAKAPLASGGYGTPHTPAKEANVEDEGKGKRPRSDEDGFKKILLLLRNQCGVDFSLYKSTTIQRRITRRMVLNRLNAPADYAAFLKGNAKELDALYSDVLISVTSFFRNPDAFEALKHKVFPKIIQQRRDDPVRIWTLGCSTGQEAYSIAISFMEFSERVARAPKLQIFATDLHDALLEKARHGLYAKSQVEDVSPERLRRFFVEEQGGYRVNKPLREMIVFARQNLISDPPFSRMDLISCRNLMIYLEPSLQKKIIPTFHYALKPEGFLFLGASESIGAFTNLFGPADKRQKIFSKKPALTGAFQLPVALGEKRGDEIHSASQKKAKDSSASAPEAFRTELNAQREADRLMVSEYAPPGVLINSELQVLQFRGDTSPYLKPPAGKASFDLLKMAREGLMLPLRAAINKAKKEHNPVRKENVRVNGNDDQRTVTIKVTMLRNLKERCYLVLFEEGMGRAALREPSREQPTGAVRTQRPASKKAEHHRNAELQHELSETRDYLQSVQEQHEAAVEELQASSEEVQSANEELQSINEELETSKEELESTNEELTTVNEEMGNRNTELHRLNSDLSNLEVNINTAILLLGRDLTIRRFTPLAEKIFNLLATDVGRSLAGIRHNLDFPGLEQFVNEVIDTVKANEREVRDNQGRWCVLRARPYMTLDNKIDGAVLVLVDIDALKRSEQEIKRARDYAEAILRTGRDPLVILRADLRVNSANEAFYKNFKLTPDVTEGRSIFELSNGAWDIPQLRKLLEDVLPRNSFFNDLEVVHDFHSIGKRTLMLNGRQVNSEADIPGLILLAIEDVTERLESRVAMKRSELRYRRLFEAADNGIIIIDTVSRKIIEANPFILELLGYTREELVGKELWQIGLLKDEQASHAAFRELQNRGSVRYEDLPLQTKSGEKREVEFVSTLYEENGSKVIQCNIRDITERRQGEEILRQSEERFRMMADNISQLAWTCDQLGDVTWYNQRWLDYTGLTFEEMRDWGWKKVHHSDHVDRVVESVTRSRESGEAWEDTFPLLGKDGNYRWFLSRAFPIRDPGGNIVHWFGTNTDVTELRETQNALREAKDRLTDRAGELERLVAERTAELTTTNQQLEAFVYSIAHDLRAPLRAMQGFSAMLVEEVGAEISEVGRDYAERINKSAQFMDALLSALLDFSRISQQRVELTSVDLGTVVESVLSRLQSDIQEKSARVENSGSWPSVLAHQQTLAQVLFNLASNALKFVAPDMPPVLRLWAEQRDEFIRVWVEDNGIGIEPEHQEQIFRLFCRLYGEKYPGTGIGLAIVQKGVHRMGGTVGLESALSQGCRFWIDLRKA